MSLLALARVASILLASPVALAAIPLTPMQDSLEADPQTLVDAEEFEARVVVVVSLIRFEVEHRTARFPFQLADVWDPNPPGLSEQARSELEEMLLSQRVRLRIRGLRRAAEDAEEGVLTVAGEDLRENLLARGLLIYCPTSGASAALVQAQERARGARAGLWSRPSSTDVRCPSPTRGPDRRPGSPRRAAELARAADGTLEQLPVKGWSAERPWGCVAAWRAGGRESARGQRGGTGAGTTIDRARPHRGNA